MIPILVDGPAVEPITLAEMKAYLRVDDDDPAQDSVIAGLVKAARLTVEGASRRVLIEQRWRVALDRWPQDRVVLLPLSPLISVESIKVFDAKGAAASIAAGAIDSDRFSDPPRLAVPDAPEPGRARNGILIEVLAGYGGAAEAVPAGPAARHQDPGGPLVREPGRRGGRADPAAGSLRPRGAVPAGAALILPCRCHSGAAQRSPESITADRAG